MMKQPSLTLLRGEQRESKGTHCRSRKVKILVGPRRALAQSWEMREGPLRLLGKVTLREQGSDLSTGTGYIYSTPSPELRTPLPDLAFASPHPPTPTIFPLSHGFAGGSDGKEFCLPMQKTQVQSLGREDPLEKEMATHSNILA